MSEIIEEKDIFAIPVRLSDFENWMNEKNEFIECAKSEDRGENINLLIEPILLGDYYNRYYTSIINMNDKNIEIENEEYSIPVHFENTGDNYKIIPLSEVEDQTSTFECYTMVYDFGKGTKEYLLMKFDIHLIESSFDNDEDIIVNLPFGNFLLSFEDICMILSDKQLKSLDSINFFLSDKHKGIYVDVDIDKDIRSRVIDLSYEE